MEIKWEQTDQICNGQIAMERDSTGKLTEASHHL